MLSWPLAARGESPAAFGRRCIPPGFVAPRSNTPGILTRRALPVGRIAALGATPDFHHGLLAADSPGGRELSRWYTPRLTDAREGESLAGSRPQKISRRPMLALVAGTFAWLASVALIASPAKSSTRPWGASFNHPGRQTTLGALKTSGSAALAQAGSQAQGGSRPQMSEEVFKNIQVLK